LLAELAEAEAAGMAADLSRDDLEALGTCAAEVRLAQTRAALDVHRAAKATTARRAAVLALGGPFADFSPVIGAESPRKRGAEPFWPKARDWQPFL
jgi:hypothetical protein